MPKSRTTSGHLRERVVDVLGTIAKTLLGAISASWFEFEEPLVGDDLVRGRIVPASIAVDRCGLVAAPCRLDVPVTVAQSETGPQRVEAEGRLIPPFKPEPAADTAAASSAVPTSIVNRKDLPPCSAPAGRVRECLRRGADRGFLVIAARDAGFSGAWPMVPTSGRADASCRPAPPRSRTLATAGIASRVPCSGYASRCRVRRPSRRSGR